MSYFCIILEIFNTALFLIKEHISFLEFLYHIWENHYTRINLETSVIQSVRHVRCIGNRTELYSGSTWFQTWPGYQQPWLGSRNFCESIKSPTSVPFDCNARLIPHTLLPSVLHLKFLLLSRSSNLNHRYLEGSR